MDMDMATSLSLAVCTGDESAVESMLKECDPNQPMDRLMGTTPLHVLAQISSQDPAVKTRVLEVAQLLLNRGAQLLENKFGCTPLHNAFEENNVPLIALLLTRIPEDASSTNYKGLSILHIICIVHAGLLEHGLQSHQIKSYAELLLQRGTDVNAACQYWQTALHLASSFADTNMISLLLDRGADLEATNRKGFTPLLYTCTLDLNYTNIDSWVHDRRKVMEQRKLNIACLLDRGASVYAVCRDGQMTALIGKVSILHLLSCIYTEDNAPVNDQIAELLLSRGADVNAQDERLQTPLHYTGSRTCQSSYLKVLLRYGADVNAQDVYKDTPVSVLYKIIRKFTSLQLRRIPANTKKNLGELIRHAQRLITLGQYVATDVKKIIEIYHRDLEINLLENECVNELERMRLVRIDDNTTLYRLLQRGRVTTGLCLDDSRLQSIMKQFEIAKNYPNYADFLHSQVRRARLLVAAEAVMRLLAHCELPSLCCETIFNYLTEADLLRLVAVGKTGSRSD